MADDAAASSINPVELATELTIAWLGNPNVRAAAEDVPAFLRLVHATIGELANNQASAPADAAPEHIPAAPVRSSVKPDYIVSLIDGRKLKSLKRHLSTHGLTPQQYRERYGLKPDYPMVASNYSAQRRAVAQKLGLGRKRRGARGAARKSAPPSTPGAVTAKTADAGARPGKRGVAKAKPAPKTAPAKRPRAKKVAASGA